MVWSRIVHIQDNILGRRCHLDSLHFISFRPSIQQVLDHPAFWDIEQKLSFLLDLSDELEVLPVSPSPRLVLLLCIIHVVGYWVLSNSVYLYFIVFHVSLTHQSTDHMIVDFDRLGGLSLGISETGGGGADKTACTKTSSSTAQNKPHLWSCFPFHLFPHTFFLLPRGWSMIPVHRFRRCYQEDN